MNQLDHQLDALGRIIVQIKAYKRQPEIARGKIVAHELGHYLRQHLSPDEWELWQSLHTEANEAE